MTVYVCPTRDIECGSNPAHWCHTCPQQHRTEPDCRTCSHYGVSIYEEELGCTLLHQTGEPCTNADRYQPLPPVRLYRSKTC